MIAQKARRLEDKKMDKIEADYLCKYLQELFESAKNRGVEPENKYYDKGKAILKSLNVYPFGLTKADV
ncbi:MAG: hypothetical protein EHM20_07185 [Alphaproteobacteria bacterium]|nr:MAG: hypothetical protein EHM20_07185 [Alphaproteobacteria bacterium]